MSLSAFIAVLISSSLSRSLSLSLSLSSRQIDAVSKSRNWILSLSTLFFEGYFLHALTERRNSKGEEIDEPLENGFIKSLF